VRCLLRLQDQSQRRPTVSPVNRPLHGWGAGSVTVQAGWYVEVAVVLEVVGGGGGESVGRAKDSVEAGCIKP
jgi:hypothetical protein